MPNAHFDYVLGRRQTNVSFEINTGGTPPLCRGARATIFQEVNVAAKIRLKPSTKISIFNRFTK